MKPLRGPIQWVVLLIIIAVVVVGLPALLTPWGFFMGGRFHVIPSWTGWGKMHSNKAGGDYVIMMTISPKTGKGLGPAHVDGNAWLCTPRGEKFTLHLGGDFQKDIRLDSNGKTASFYMNTYTVKSQFTGDDRPYLEFRGKWNNPDLVLDDHGSIARNFAPDATLWPKRGNERPYISEVVPVTLHEGGKTEWEAACAKTSH
ncbi:MAG TPA: hypothetical protein VFW31_15675 [Candidatus Angelobacter sp.]|nr:hypothetical protein [Candidatus Angelobacter sp.]